MKRGTLSIREGAGVGAGKNALQAPYIVQVLPFQCVLYILCSTTYVVHVEGCESSVSECASCNLQGASRWGIVNHQG